MLRSAQSFIPYAKPSATQDLPRATTLAVGEESGGVGVRVVVSPATIAALKSLRGSEIPYQAAKGQMVKAMQADPYLPQFLNVKDMGDLAERVLKSQLDVGAIVKSYVDEKTIGGNVTTQALGEEGGAIATTQAVGEEGGSLNRKSFVSPQTLVEVNALRSSEIPHEAALGQMAKALKADPILRRHLNAGEMDALAATIQGTQFTTTDALGQDALAETAAIIAHAVIAKSVSFAA